MEAVGTSCASHAPPEVAPNPDAAAQGDVPLADDSAPKSTSSAMPDLNSSSVPRLQARVHRELSPQDCAAIPLESIGFRALEAGDYEEMVALHTEWFPVAYDEAFYKKSVRGEIITIAATHTRPGGTACSSSSKATPDTSTGNAPGPCGAADCRDQEEHVLGIVTMTTTCDFHGEDIQHVLGGDCESLCYRHPGDEVPSGCLAYILTLGVIDGFRRRGLAKELLRRSIMHVDRRLPHVQAIYLHVVTYNEAAINLYETMRFLQLGRFTSFYQIHGQPYDSFLYALYVNGGRPPWKVRLKSFLGWGASTSWKDWVVSAFSSLWRGGEGPSQGSDRTSERSPLELP